MSIQYQYVKIGGRYYCLQQNPAVLTWFLCVRDNSLRLGCLGFSRKKAVNVVKTFIQHRLRLRSSPLTLELPVYGNFCLPVHRGYRVFNLQRKTVVRLFAPEVDAAIVEGEIAGVRNASLLDFAPTVQRWDTKERWYEEDFVIGQQGYLVSKSEPVLKTYYQDIAPCIERMILLQAPLSTNLYESIDRTTGILKDDRLSEPGLEARKLDVIRDFVASTAEQLYLEENRQIDLVFSHGDFSLVNILSTKDGIMVVDWESAGHRSTLFDLYNYFFTEAYYGRATTDLVSEINEAISSLQSRLTSKAPDIARTLPSLAEVYRRLYYLERVLMLLERELSNDLLDVILRSIAVFNRYEEAVASAVAHVLRDRSTP